MEDADMADIEGLPLPPMLQEAIAGFLQSEVDEGLASSSVPRLGNDEHHLQISGPENLLESNGESDARCEVGSWGFESKDYYEADAYCGGADAVEVVAMKRSRKAVSQFFEEDQGELAEDIQAEVKSRSEAYPCTTPFPSIPERGKLRTVGGIRAGSKKKRKTARGRKTGVGDIEKRAGPQRRINGLGSTGEWPRQRKLPPGEGNARRKDRQETEAAWRWRGGLASQPRGRSLTSPPCASGRARGGKDAMQDSGEDETKSSSSSSSDYGSWDSGDEIDDAAWRTRGSVFLGRDIVRVLKDPAGGTAVGRAYGKVVGWLPKNCLQSGAWLALAASPCVLLSLC